MIPMGNWEETNDELRNEIADLEQEIEVLQSENRTLVIEKEELQSALNAADTDIADYLFELDHLHHNYSGLELDVEGLLLLVEYWQEKAATAEANYEAQSEHLRTWAGLASDRALVIESLSAELLTAQNEAHEEWARANDLETYSISIEESRELTNRNLELEKEVSELRSQLDEADRSHGELDFIYRNLLDSHIELKKALNTLSE